jgi:DNA-directed RNA polymerase specialized sigma24 family protein
MTSSALPPTSPAPALRAERDLARAAARGDRPAFDELYRRLAPPAWRLAAAVAPDAGLASSVVADGFVRALRSTRRSLADGAVGAHVLSGVYRSALDRARRAGPPAQGSGGAATLEAAFRALPERWRAALWLREVEGADAGYVAAVLGVSPAGAGELARRGREGIAGRLSEGGDPVPVDLGAALAPLGASMPAGLADAVADHWQRATVVDRAARFAPVPGLMGERAQRSLGAAVGGLLALSVIALGVVSQPSTPANPPVASGATNRFLGLAQPAALQSPAGGPALTLLGGPHGAAGGLTLAADLRGGASASAGSGSAGGTSTATHRSGRMSSRPPAKEAGSPPPVTKGSGGSQPTPEPAPRTTTTTTTTTTPTTTPTTQVNIPGVLAVGSGGGTTSATVLPSSSGSSAASATVCPDGESLSVLGIKALSQCPTSKTTTTSTTTTTTTTTLPLGNLGL